MKMPEKSAVRATAVFIVLALRPKIAPHIRGDVQRGLGEQPEGEDTEDDTEEHTIVASELAATAGFGLAGC